MEVALRILPVFAVILAGALAKSAGLLSARLLAWASRLVFYVAIPCLIFLTILKSPVELTDAAGALLTACAALSAAWAAASYASNRLATGARGPALRASFIHTAIHGNISIMGFALAYYGLGARGLSCAAIVAAGVIPLQNVLGVVALTAYGAAKGGERRAGKVALNIVTNPIIIGTGLGVLALETGFNLPGIMASTLEAVAAVALPLALVIIGANLSLRDAGPHRAYIGLGLLIKLVLLPGLGVGLGRALGLSGLNVAAAAMILAAPSAVVSPIMAREMGGDAGYSAMMVTVSTLASAPASYLWLLILA